MKKLYIKPIIEVVTLSCNATILAGSEEKGVVKPGQGAGTTENGDEYITLSKHHNAWNAWDDE